MVDIMNKRQGKPVKTEEATKEKFIGYMSDCLTESKA